MSVVNERTLGINKWLTESCSQLLDMMVGSGQGRNCSKNAFVLHLSTIRSPREQSWLQLQEFTELN